MSVAFEDIWSAFDDGPLATTIQESIDILYFELSSEIF